MEGMNMTEHLSIKEWTMNILGHLEETCNIAHLMMQDGFITPDEYDKHFNNVIAQMEDRVRSVKERIECKHDTIRVLDVSSPEGTDIIDIVWLCDDCDTKMKGYLHMGDLWQHGSNPEYIQQEFEKVKL
jgi:hypothetical protein